MIKMNAKKAICIVAASFLTACGGGDGSDVTSVADPQGTSDADPQGFWLGKSSSGRTIAMLVLETGQYFAAYSFNNSVEGMIEGTFAVDGPSISDHSAIDLNLAVGASAVPAKIKGMVAAKQKLIAVVKEATQTQKFDATYNSAYDTSPSVSEVAGTWAATVAGSAAPTTMTVAGDGSFTGASGSCTFSGSLKPRASGKKVLDGTVTFEDTSCPLGAGTSIDFEAVTANNQMIAAGVNSARSAGFVFVGIRMHWEVSRPGELHPESLAHPNVSLSAHSAAGSTGGISPPAAHRTVRKRLHLHGSSQPFPCHLAMAKRRGRSKALPGFPVGDNLP
ncbi:hypothetical protein AB4Y42_34900 [Paraburkholderia sp. EG286B]|uniref:hypothetical protein n=1 Tax=Paraburkholderia sp. EG286B TaxID=3237011 RepID=UPI0034D305F1